MATRELGASGDETVTFHTQKGTFALDNATLGDPYETAREFARAHRLMDTLRPPYGAVALNNYRRIVGERQRGQTVFTWRLIWLIQA